MDQLAALLPQSPGLPVLADAELAAARSFAELEKAAAIRYAHRLAGHEPPTSAETVRAVMRGIRRSIGTAKDQKAPATADLIMSMLKLCPDTLAGKRDRALIALGFAGAFRRSELVALTMADLVEAPDGYRVLILHSKADQEGQGQEIAIPRGYRPRPVEAVQTWLAAAEINDGPVFRPVLKGSRIQATTLAAHAVAAIVKRYAVGPGWIRLSRFRWFDQRDGFAILCWLRFAMMGHGRQVSDGGKRRTTYGFGRARGVP